MDKLFYELEAIPSSEISYEEYKSMLAKFYYSQPVNKVYRDILKFNINTLDAGKKQIFIDMAVKIFVHGPDKRDISAILPENFNL